MSNMGTLASTSLSNVSDTYLVRQSGIDYKQSREVLAAALSSARWSNLTDYTSGSWITGSNGDLYQAQQGSGISSSPVDPVADLDWSHWRPLWSYQETENRFKGNQNWNVVGSSGDPLPDGTPRTYVVGSEIVSGVEVITTDAEQVTYVSGVLNSGNNTGILRRRYSKDLSGLITKSSQYGAIRLPDNSQLQALIDDIATNGVRITEDGSDVVVDVDLSVVNAGFRFFGMSDNIGNFDNINDQDSYLSQTGMRIVNRTPVSTADSYEIDSSGKITYYLSSTLTTVVAGDWVSVNINLPFTIPNGVLSKVITMDAPSSNQGLEVALDSTTSVATLYFRSDSPISQSVTVKIEAY